MAIPKADYIWFNGEFVPWDEAKVHVLAHVLHYGSSAFEVLRADKTPQGTLSFFAVETDAQLGVPPQDLFNPPFQCFDCEDYVRFNGSLLSDSLGWT